jgi:hypothetical protein
MHLLSRCFGTAMAPMLALLYGNCNPSEGDFSFGPVTAAVSMIESCPSGISAQSRGSGPGKPNPLPFGRCRVYGCGVRCHEARNSCPPRDISVRTRSDVLDQGLPGPAITPDKVCRLVGLPGFKTVLRAIRRVQIARSSHLLSVGGTFVQPVGLQDGWNARKSLQDSSGQHQLETL